MVDRRTDTPTKVSLKANESQDRDNLYKSPANPIDI